jgi:hypothetical protein
MNIVTALITLMIVKDSDVKGKEFFELTEVFPVPAYRFIHVD